MSIVAKPIVVIGGGPAGLMAAGQAASQGASVFLLERTGRLGSKLRLTGGGRCNLTNTAAPDEFLAHFGSSRFLRNALARYSSHDLIAFLEGLGIPTRVEQGGRVFPASGGAAGVAEALAGYARSQGVQVRLHSRAVRLLAEGGRLAGVLLEGGESLDARAAVVATGGASFPRTGSTGDGYALAAGAGHTITSVHPALVPLLVAGPEPSALMGLSLQGVELRLLLDGQEVGGTTGDVLFTHYGLSGPAVLALSGKAVECLGRGSLEVSINLRPALARDALDADLRLSLGRAGRRSARTWLREFVPPKMLGVLLQRLAISPGKPAHQVTAAERERLRALLHDFRMPVSGHRSWDEAMVTAGGVDTREVDPRSMGSRLVAGLYFAGELLDAHGDTGGFNLQAAFSTGYVAGRSAAESLEPFPDGDGRGGKVSSLARRERAGVRASFACHEWGA